ncbi:unnamed protein product [Urochloa decumbens]|uniref:Receptor-like serine/threonine-protein kinase n=1 Tax=Urochloa decumbens TaxID=240449 RepID=A0ABC9DI00_9POAL
MESLKSFVFSLASIRLIILGQPLQFISTAAQTNQLTAGSRIIPTQYLTSSSGLFAFGFCNVDPSINPQKLILAIWFDFGASNCSNKTVVWFARDPTSKSAVIATNGSVLILDDSTRLSLVDGQATLWSPSQQFGSTLMLLDSGNLQLIAAGRGGVSWESFHHPTHALLPGQNMTNSSGIYLLSTNTDMDFSAGRFTLIVQDDDNIVMYMRDPNQISSLAGNAGDPYWNSQTWHSGQVPTIVFDDSGNLFYNDSLNGYKNLTAKRPPSSAQSYYHYAALDPDGTVRVYAHQKNITDGIAWEVVSMFPADGCSRMTKYSIQSICGPNAYCKVSSSKGQRINCECPYGYVFLDEQHEYRGCGPNYVPGPLRSIRLYIIIGVLAISFVTSVTYTLWQGYASKKAKRMRLSAGLRTFTQRELKRATKGFKVLLGEGGFGKVYKGEVSYPQPANIAVKKLIKSDEHSERDFENEVQSIGQIHHKNLVRMIGYCKEGAHRMLVFEYMQGGTLADFVFQSERPPWNFLADAAIGIAKGLEYLHEGCKSQIIHCDIKPDNILFDDKHTARITDFGIAKLLGDQKTQHTVTTVAGTVPYVAPEWFGGVGKVNSKVDVYSFGVVLLEMICCKKVTGGQMLNQQGALRDLVNMIESGRAELLVQGESEALADMESGAVYARGNLVLAEGPINQAKDKQGGADVRRHHGSQPSA